MQDYVRSSYPREFLESLKVSPAWNLFIQVMVDKMSYVQDQIVFRMNGFEERQSIAKEWVISGDFESTIGDEMLYVWKHREVAGKHKYTLMRVPGFTIAGESIKRLMLNGSVKVMYEKEYDEEQQLEFKYGDYGIVEWYNKTIESVYQCSTLVVVLVENGALIDMYTRVGVISYSDKIISLGGRTETNLEVVYISADPLSVTSKNMFPVLKDVQWEQQQS